MSDSAASSFPESPPHPDAPVLSHQEEAAPSPQPIEPQASPDSNGHEAHALPRAHPETESPVPPLLIANKEPEPIQHEHQEQGEPFIPLASIVVEHEPSREERIPMALPVGAQESPAPPVFIAEQLAVPLVEPKIEEFHNLEVAELLPPPIVSGHEPSLAAPIPMALPLNEPESAPLHIPTGLESPAPPIVHEHLAVPHAEPKIEEESFAPPEVGEPEHEISHEQIQEEPFTAPILNEWWERTSTTDPSDERQLLPLDETETETEESFDSPDSTPSIGEEELESALEDFRDWFADAAEHDGLPPQSELPTTIDLSTLLGHFVGLRQEINLQTRAVRSQQEITTDTVGNLQKALELAQRNQTRAEQAERQNREELLRPLLGTLADLYDSLSTASAQIKRVTSIVLPRLQEMQEQVHDQISSETTGHSRDLSRSFWSSWILSPTADDAIRANLEQARQAELKVQRDREDRRRRSELSTEARGQVEDALSALLSGYTMNLERVERSLRKYNLEPIQAIGTRFDPETMESLDGVTGTGRPQNEVVEEVQRGYLLNGKVFRYARVRVARN